MATTFTDLTGTGAASRQFSFPSYKVGDIKVEVDGVDYDNRTISGANASTTTFTISGYTTTGGGYVVFDTAPTSPADIHIYRDTDVESAKATYTAGSSVKAGDLNNNHTQLLYALQEEQNQLIRSGDIKDAAIITSKIKDLNVTRAKIANDAIDSTKLADNAVGSEHYQDGSIDLIHMSANSVDSNQYVDGSIDHVHLANDVIDGDNIQDSVINSEHYVDGSIDREHLAADIVDSTKIADDAIGAEHIQANSVSDSEIVTGTLDNRYYRETELDGGQLDNRYYREDELNPSASVGNNVLDARYYTETEAEARFLRQDSSETIASGDTWSGTDSKVATTAAIDLRIIDLVDDVGGFVAVNNETSFPTANPDVNNGTGTIVSVKAASTALTPSGTTVTIANGAGSGNTVTITGVTSTIPSGYGFLVETTTTLHTYTFHRLVPKATEVSTIAANAVNISAAGANIQDIHNFADLYQISTSAPTTRADTSSLVAGDLWYDSSSNKVLMIYDGSTGDGFTAATPNASDLANIAIVAGQIVFTEDLGNITDTVATATGNTTLNTVAGIATETAAVAGIASAVSTVAADGTDIGIVAGKETEIGRLGTADAVADMNTLGTTAIVSDMDTLADISSNITTVAGISSNVSTVAGVASNVTAVAGNATNINAVAADATDIGAVAGKATEIGRLGTADAVADLAILGTTDVVADMNTLATTAIVADMDTLANNATNIATVAGIDSNVTTIAGIASNVTTAAGNNANISTVAGNNANITTVAGANSNISTLAGSIANVNTAASNVTNINNFANRYRIASSAPGSNNDAGDLYFDTSSNELRVYNGSAWQGGVTATGNLAGLGANTFTGAQTFASGQTFDGRDVSADGAKLDAITTSSGAILNGVTATTQSASDNSTKVATTAYTDTAISNLVDSSPSALNTLNELAAALGDDANFATTVNNSISANTTAINLRMPVSGGTFVDTVHFGGTNYNAKFNKANSRFDLNDNFKLTLGTSQDLEIYHSGTSSFILNNEGNLIISNMDPDDDNDIILRARQNESSIVCKNDGATELYHNGNKKLETTSSGATVTGTCTATTFSGSGASLTSLNGSQVTSGTIAAARVATLNQNTTGSSGSCTGNAATASNASQLQGYTSSDSAGNNTIVRRNASGYIYGNYLNATGTFGTSGSASGMGIFTGTNGSDTFGRSYTAAAARTLLNVENGATADQTASEILTLIKTVDGGGSGLDADTVDGLDVHTGRNNGANKIVRTEGNGYLDTGYINTSTNDTGTGADCTRFYASEDAYIRYIDKASMRSVVNTPGNSTAYAGRESYSTDTNYWVGSCGHGSYDLDSTLWRYGSCFWDAWSSPAGQPSGSTHWNGMQAMHYTNGNATHYGFRFACGSGNPAHLYVQGRWNTTTNGWHKLWNAANDGSGSGLDADLLDGVHGSSFLRSDTADTATGTIGFSGGAGAVTISANSDLRLSNGSWSGDTTKLQHHSNYLYITGGSSGHILRDTSGHNNLVIDANGNGTFVGNVTAYSDKRLKTNVSTIDNALDIVDQLRGVSFDWIRSGKHSIGVIAQEVEKVIPEVVLTSQDLNPSTGESIEVKSVDYGKMVGVLINAIKELRAEVDELKGGK